MAVGVVMDLKGATLDQHDQVMEKMGLTGGHEMPAGGLAHWVAETDDGIRVIDIWEARAVREVRAGADRSGTAEVGIEGAPETTF